MGKIRRGNFVFLTWIGDHSPRHVHVYRDTKLIVKWDLENWQAMEGRMVTYPCGKLSRTVLRGERAVRP